MGGGYSAPAPKKSVHYASFEQSLPKMEGKVVVITGCTSGTGFVAACAMAKKGAHVVMLNRKSERSEKAYKQVNETIPGAQVTAIDCDLMDFSSVRNAASLIKEKFAGGVDVLCNNAGIMGDEDMATKDGYDVQMQTNHLSHFLLTKEIFPLLEAAAQKRGEARIVNHSSGARKYPSTPFDPKYLGKNGGNLGGNGNSMIFGGARWQRYHQSKLANVLFTLALNDRLRAKGSKVKAMCAAPGLAATNLQVTSTNTGGMGWTWFTRLFMGLSQSAEDGTMPLLHCMTAAAAESGDFVEPDSGGGTWGLPAKKALEPICTNAKDREALWVSSGDAVGPFEL